MITAVAFLRNRVVPVTPSSHLNKLIALEPALHIFDEDQPVND
jgi:hypothetical protein